MLQGQGVSDLEFVVITAPGPAWENHAAGYEQAEFPVMSDTDGVFFIYGAAAYDVVLVDKKGRLVTKVSGFDGSQVEQINRRVRELHAE